MHVKKNFSTITTVISIIVLFLIIICSFSAFPKLIDYAIFKKTALVEGNEVFSIWQKQPFPLQFKAILFNVTNPEEVMNGGQPNVKEIGPYIYDLYIERVNITVNENDDTITYLLKRKFYFNPKENCRSEDDIVTLINAALVSTAAKVYYTSPSALPIINQAVPYLFKGAKDIFLRTTVREILFDGVVISCHDPEVDFICAAMKSMLPPTIEAVEGDFKFSTFGYLNRTLMGPFTMGRGIKKTRKGQLYSYHGDDKLSVWNGATCNMINGSDSMLLSPMKTPPPRIYAFSPDVCRSMYVNYETNVEFQGISVWKYSATAESVANSEENKCFCPTIKDELAREIMKCPKDGLIDLSACVKAPLLLSYPHFLFGDPSLLNYVHGLNPNKSLHENFVYLEPTVGTPISGAKRIQLNVEVKQLDDFTLLNNVSDGVFPLLWVEETAVIPPEMIAMFSKSLSLIKFIQCLRWVLIVVGILFVAGSFIWVLYRRRMVCFANMGSNTVAITEMKSNNRVSPASNSDNETKS